MSVRDNVAYGLMVKGVGKRERADARRRGAGDGPARRPRQAQARSSSRAASASASRSPARSSTGPRVLLLDEPLGALDLKLRLQMQLELKGIQRELSEDITFIYVTHDQDEALTMSDRIAVFSEGRLEQVGTPGEIYEHPANEFVAGFVGTSNVIERDGARFTVRPEKIHLLTDGAEVPGGMQSAAGAVREVVYLGSVTRYVVDLDEGQTLVALRQNLDTSAGEALAERGRRVRLAWAPQHANEVASRPRGGDAMRAPALTGLALVACGRHGRRRVRRRVAVGELEVQLAAAARPPSGRRRRPRTPSCRPRSARARASSA